MSTYYVVVDADDSTELADRERQVMVDLPEGHTIEFVPEPPIRRVYRVVTG